MKRTFALVLAAVLAASSDAAQAAPACRDSKGKFIKCPPTAAAATRCKDAKGKFTKCGLPGAVPVKAK